MAVTLAALDASMVVTRNLDASLAVGQTGYHCARTSPASHAAVCQTASFVRLASSLLVYSSASRLFTLTLSTTKP